MINYSGNRYFTKPLFLLVVTFFIFSCRNKPANDFIISDLTPKLEPDYSDITIPPNIAPLNFIIKEKGESFYVKFSSESGSEFDVYSGDGKVNIPVKKWKKMLYNNKGKKFSVDIYSIDEQENG